MAMKYSLLSGIWYLNDMWCEKEKDNKDINNLDDHSKLQDIDVIREYKKLVAELDRDSFLLGKETPIFFKNLRRYISTIIHKKYQIE